MIANLKVGKTIKALANLTTPLTPQNPFAPWGVSPQAERLPSNNYQLKTNNYKKYRSHLERCDLYLYISYIYQLKE